MRLLSVILMALLTACSETKFGSQDQAVLGAGKNGIEGVACEKMDGCEVADVEVADVEEPVEEVDEQEGEDQEGEEQEGEESDMPVADFEAECDKFKQAQNLQMQTSVAFHHVRGGVAVKAETVDLDDIRGGAFVALQNSPRLHNIRGSICLVGLKLGGVLGTARLTDHRGHVIVQDLNMDVIENTRGTLIIRGGEVKVIRKHRGSIHLIGAKVGAFEDIRGPVTEAAP